MKHVAVPSLILFVSGLLCLTSIGGCSSRRGYSDAMKLGAEQRHSLMSRGMSGDPDAAFRIYEMYALGLHRQKDAFQWLQIAANNGHRVAAYNLGFEYYFHRHDLESAALWWKIAAERGDKQAESMLRNYDLDALRK